MKEEIFTDCRREGKLLLDGKVSRGVQKKALKDVLRVKKQKRF